MTYAIELITFIIILLYSLFLYLVVALAAAVPNLTKASKTLHTDLQSFSAQKFSISIQPIGPAVRVASASYAVSECFGWSEGLSKKFLQGPRFYGIIIASTVTGLWINFSSIDPIHALIYTAVINGIVSVPLLIIIVKIANNKKILRDKVNNKISNVIALVTIIAMASASAAMVIVCR